MTDLILTGLKAHVGKQNAITVEESRKGKLSVVLLPVSTSTKLFHEVIQPNAKEIRFIKGRIKFVGMNTKGELVDNESPMHDSMIVVF